VFHLVLVLFAAVTAAQAPATGPEFQVNTYTTYNQFSPAVASDPEGSLVVVWTSWNQDGSGDGVFGQRFDGAGHPIGHEFQVNGYTTGYQAFPDLAMDAAGNFVVVWSTVFPSNGPLLARRFDSEGIPLGNEFQVAGQGGLSRVAMTPDGGFVVVWQAHPQNDESLGVLGRQFDSLGVPRGGAFQVNTYTAGEQYRPTVAVSESGDFIVAWADKQLFSPTGGRDGSGGAIFGQRFDRSGDRKGTEFRVNTYTPYEQDWPQIAADDDGNFVVVWQSVDGSDFGISGQRFDASGRRLGGEFLVNSDTSGSQYAPDLSADADGHFVVAWLSGSPTAMSVLARRSPTAMSVLARRFRSDGTPRGDDFEVDASVPPWFGPMEGPSVAVGGAGQFAIAWSSEDADGTGIAARVGGENCLTNSEALCLSDRRFRVSVDWSVPSQGRSGAGTAVPLTGDTGYFWFFDSANVELVVKVLDGRSINGNYWVFYGGLSNVQYTITVTDTVTGEVKTYENAAGTLASVADTSAFTPAVGSLETPTASAEETEWRSAEELYGLYSALPKSIQAASPSPAEACAPGATSLCLNRSRFQVTVDWEVPSQGRSGHGTAVPITGDTGYFWFFSDANIELVFKVLDGRSINGHFWVFYGALSNVRYTITVTDTEAGAVRTYENPSGNLASVADTEAF
jgi:hypothetical protein